jgi:hypothetical protein
MTVEGGIQIQQEHLQQWKTVLKPEVYDKLEKWATLTNNEARTGYEIRRGTDLSNYVQNLSLFGLSYELVDYWIDEEGDIHTR